MYFKYFGIAPCPRYPDAIAKRLRRLQTSSETVIALKPFFGMISPIVYANGIWWDEDL